MVVNMFVSGIGYGRLALVGRFFVFICSIKVIFCYWVFVGIWLLIVFKSFLEKIFEFSVNSFDLVYVLYSWCFMNGNCYLYLGELVIRVFNFYWGILLFFCGGKC